MKAVQRRKMVMLVPPKDINGAPQGGNFQFVSLGKYRHAIVHIFFGAIGGDCAITLQQAKNVGGNGAKSLSYDTIYAVQSDAGAPEDQDKAVPVAVSNGSYTPTHATDDNYHYMIELRPDKLDRNNGFDCIRPNLSDPAASTIVCVVVELCEPRYSGEEDELNVFPSSLDET